MRLPCPEKSFYKNEFLAKLDAILERLPFENRSVFVLAEFEGLTYAEIAEIEEISIGTVKSRLSRTKEKLRSVFKEYKD